MPKSNVRYGFRSLIYACFVRAGPPIIALLIAIAAFQMGVNVSDKGDIPDRDLFVQMYYAIGLFTLGGMDLGMPIEGPFFWRYLLLFDYFLAPTIAAAAVIEGVYVTALPWLVLHWPWRDHIVIAGGGRVARSFVEAAWDMFPNARILIVEKEEDYPNRDFFASLKRVYLINGSIDDAQLLPQLRITHAKLLLFVTSDEVANIETAFQLFKISIKPSFVRIADLRLIERTRTLLPKTSNSICMNIHQVVAQHFCSEATNFIQKSDDGDIIIFAGFGRFSQTFLRELRKSNVDIAITKIKIIDPKAGLCWAIFYDSLQENEKQFFDRASVQCIHEIQRDPRAWDKTLEKESVGKDGSNMLIIFGSNQDQENLRSALWLEQKYPKALLAVRMFSSSHFSRLLSENTGIHIIDSGSILKRPINDWLKKLSEEPQYKA